MADYIFISYVRRDEDFALRRAGDLKDHGLPVWLDQWDIQRGENRDRAIARAINGCAVFLTVLSPAAIASDTVLNELARAKDKQKRLIPVRQEPCELPLLIQTTLYLDFSERAYADALGDLLSDVGALPETPIRSATPAEAPPVRVARLPFEPELVSVPAGPFLMGTADEDSQADDYEKPQHRVTLPAFEIGRYPVN